jgi:hypothetical protein
LAGFVIEQELAESVSIIYDELTLVSQPFMKSPF